MMKRIPLTAGAALLAATLAFSPAAHAADNSNASGSTGFYAGGFGGYGWTANNINPGPTVDANGSDWGLFAGYDLGPLIDTKLTGAVEFGYAWGNEGGNRTVGLTNYGAQKDHEWDLSFRPGLSFITDAEPFGAKPYAILGWRRAEFRTTTAGAPTTDDHNGFDLGIGTELVAYKNYGVRLDYEHVFYGSDGGVSPDENDLRLGVAYHF